MPHLRLRAFARRAGIAVALVGLLVLVGWAFDLPALKSVLPGLATMKANTALAFVLAGLSLRIAASNQGQRRLGQGGAAVVALVGLLTLLEYLAGWDLGIDQGLFGDAAVESGAAYPGRMSPATALGFLLAGLALLLLDRNKGSLLSQVLALAAILPAFLGVVGYCYGVSALYHVGPYASMALHTALGLVLLGAGVLSARPEGGFASVLISNTPGGEMLRRLLPAVVGVPLVLGWIRLEGERAGLYGTEFGLALFAVTNVGALAALLWWNARLLHRAAMERYQAEDQLIVLSRAVAHSPVSILITDTAGNIEYVNPKFTQVTGYTGAEVRGKNPRLLKSGQTPPEVFKDLWQTITAGRDWRGEFCNKKKNGELYWDFAWIAPIRNAEGQITHYLGIQEDITARKLAEGAMAVNLALQRVRNETLSLEKPEDWERIALACRRELDPLVRFAGCSIVLADLQQGTGMAYYCPSPGRVEAKSYASIHPLLISAVESGLFAYRRTRAEIARGEERIPLEINSVIDVPFASGTLAVSSTAENAFGEREISILEQFAQVLSEAHRRLQDLQVIAAEREQAEEAVQQSAESMRAVAAALPDLLFVLDEEGRYLEILTSQENLLYADAQKLKGHLLHEVLPQEAADLFLGVVRSTLSTGQSQVIEYPLDVPEGRRYFEGRTAPLPESPGEKQRVVWVSRDITERQRQEAQEQVLHKVREQVWQMKEPDDIWQVLSVIREGIEAQRLAFDECGIGLIDTTVDPPVVRFHNMGKERRWTNSDSNQATEIILRIWREGKPAYRPDLEAEDPYGERERIRQYSPAIRSVVDVPFSHGTLAINSKQPLAFSDQDIAFLQEMARGLSEGFRRLDDLRALETTEAQFRQAQKLEAIGQLAGGVAHDFNNLLTVISGYCEYLLRRLSADHPNHAHLQEIRTAAERGTGLVRQLLAFSRKQVLEPRVLDLNTVVGGLEKMLGRLIGEDVELVTRLSPDLGRVKADPGQLEQVLVNLAVNARDAMPRGGALFIETRNVGLDEHYAANHAVVAPGPYVLLEVSDTGVGMDTATQARIFEPFFTTKEPGKGTGLGLATVYGIVKQSGGYIWVYSEPGQGTSFKIYLPRLTEEAQAVVREEVVVQAGQGSETVLLVEDEAPLRQLAALILREEGYTVLEAGRGEEALSLSTQHQGPIDAVVSDMVMPGMSGPELVEELRALRPELKVLYVSGYSADIVGQRVALEPGIAFLQKPFRADTLLLKLREALDD